MIPRLCLIAAIARNNVIGNSNKLPWHIPEDLQSFKKRTLGKPIVMGRKTWESIGSKPLPGRLNIVVTRDPDFYLEQGEVYHSLHAAIRRAEWWAEDRDIPEVMLIGGADLYRQSLPYAHRLYLTQVDAEPEGDTFFPEIDPAKWACTAVSPPVLPEGETPGYAYQEWNLKNPIMGC